MQKLLGNLPRGLVFVVSAPAGTGKTTLVRMLAQEFPCIHESVSCTTRPPRQGEIDGKDYYFLSPQEFEEKKQLGDFLEHAMGNHVFLVIDTQGALQLKKKQFSAVYIFLSPPSEEELKERLVRRKTEEMEVIEKRLSWAKAEMSMVANYDYHIINDNLNMAYAVLRSIVIAEEHKIRR